MAVGLAEDENGVSQVLVGTSEPMGYLRPGITLESGETLAPEPAMPSGYRQLRSAEWPKFT